MNFLINSKIKTIKKTNNFKEKGCVIILASIFVLPFILSGIIGTFYSIKKLYQCNETRSWQTCNAEVIDVKYINEYTGEDEDSNEMVSINYQYQVNGTLYKNDKISIGYYYNTNENHVVLFEKLKNAKTIKIFYNPDKKNESVIFKGFNNSTFGGLNFMIFWDSAMFLIFFPILIPFFEKRNKTTYFIKKPMLTALFLLIITITLMIVKKPYIEMINKIEILAYKSISE